MQSKAGSKVSVEGRGEGTGLAKKDNVIDVNEFSKAVEGLGLQLTAKQVGCLRVGSADHVAVRLSTELFACQTPSGDVWLCD